MDFWIRFDREVPSLGQFIVAITQRDEDLPIDVWEAELELNAVGIWVDGEVWEGNVPRVGFTHWLPLPDRPLSGPPPYQLALWDPL